MMDEFIVGSCSYTQHLQPTYSYHINQSLIYLYPTNLIFEVLLWIYNRGLSRILRLVLVLQHN